jgi:hypothetical protein
MRRIVRIQQQGKMKDVESVALATGPASHDMDSTVALILKDLSNPLRLGL